MTNCRTCFNNYCKFVKTDKDIAETCSGFKEFVRVKLVPYLKSEFKTEEVEPRNFSVLKEVPKFKVQELFIHEDN